MKRSYNFPAGFCFSLIFSLLWLAASHLSCHKKDDTLTAIKQVDKEESQRWSLAKKIPQKITFPKAPPIEKTLKWLSFLKKDAHAFKKLITITNNKSPQKINQDLLAFKNTIRKSKGDPNHCIKTWGRGYGLECKNLLKAMIASDAYLKVAAKSNALQKRSIKSPDSLEKKLLSKDQILTMGPKALDKWMAEIDKSMRDDAAVEAEKEIINELTGSGSALPFSSYGPPKTDAEMTITLAVLSIFKIHLLEKHSLPKKDELFLGLRHFASGGQMDAYVELIKDPFLLEKALAASKDCEAALKSFAAYGNLSLLSQQSSLKCGSRTTEPFFAH